MLGRWQSAPFSIVGRVFTGSVAQGVRRRHEFWLSASPNTGRFSETPTPGGPSGTRFPVMTRRYLFSFSLMVAFFVGGSRALAAKETAKNEQIMKATDAFNELAETGIGTDAAKVEQGMKTAQSQRAATRALIAAKSAKNFDQLFAQMMAAHAKHDGVGQSLAATELYKLLVEALDGPALTVPAEVGLLDCCGLRIHALLKAPSVDWKAIAETATEANTCWARLRERVSNATLREGMDQAQQGLAVAAAKHDAALSKSSAKDNLDIVDDLESYFEHR